MPEKEKRIFKFIITGIVAIGMISFLNTQFSILESKASATSMTQIVGTQTSRETNGLDYDLPEDFDLALLARISNLHLYNEDAEYAKCTGTVQETELHDGRVSPVPEPYVETRVLTIEHCLEDLHYIEYTFPDGQSFYGEVVRSEPVPTNSNYKHDSPVLVTTRHPVSDWAVASQFDEPLLASTISGLKPGDILSLCGYPKPLQTTDKYHPQLRCVTAPFNDVENGLFTIYPAPTMDGDSGAPIIKNNIPIGVHLGSNPFQANEKAIFISITDSTLINQ